jgi:TM2 domain-containing membrane protein YozV
MSEPIYPGRSKWLAVIFAVFFGWFGAHKFYLGKTRAGIFYLLFFWSGVPLVLSLIDALILAFKPDYEFGQTKLTNPNSQFDGTKSILDKEGSENWRQDYSVYKESRPWYRSPLVWVSIVIGLLVIPNIFQNIGERPNSETTPSDSVSSSTKPRPTQTSAASSNSNEDKACLAMKNADMAVSTLAKKVLDGTAVSSDAKSITSPLNAVNSAYKSLDGDFYWYLVAQGNSMDLLQRSVKSEDWYTAGVAIGAYLDADEYPRFCR